MSEKAKIDPSLEKKLKTKIPQPVKSVLEELKQNNFESYLVGGCVRDLLLDRSPKDWDIATSAQPAEVLKIFPDAFYENRFGTVGVKTGAEAENLKVIEVTTFRIEKNYEDFRRPNEVKFSLNLEDDLKRRDFTINALALNEKFQLIDLFNGLTDLENKSIRAIGQAEERLREDALRLIRAIRFATELDFEIEPKTFAAIKKLANLIQYIAKERVKDELSRIINSTAASAGFELLRQSGLLLELIPELVRAKDIRQNKHHRYDIYDHLLHSLDYAAKKNYSLEIKLAALFHDIGKPLTKAGEYPNATFYNHEIVGAKMTRQILERLRFSKAVVAKTVHLVRYHMFYLEIEKVTMAAVRRFALNVGEENLEDLFRLREADRIGSGVAKAVPYRLRYLKFLIGKAKLKPILPTLLEIKGDEIMARLKIEPGPKVGWILKILLKEVLNQPGRNKNSYLAKRVEALGQLSDSDLKSKANEADEFKKQIEVVKEEEVKKEFRV
ncbi:MAG: HD domain-containing protein [Patescibacteria group bacterium]|nr:HD domain-containing protein [Patescibacteria group bacterium]